MDNAQEDRRERRRRLFNRKFAQLLRLSSNIETNERDHAFAKPDTPQPAQREIIYVFDHSVMEMFMSLEEDPRKYPAAFHLRDWRSPYQINDTKIEKSWEAFNRQTALIAGEYLLSGGLPGQADGQFYMTPGHYEEFCNAVERLTRELAEVHDRDRDGSAAKVAELRNALIETPPRPSDLDPDLEDDIGELFKQDTEAEAAITEFRKTRAIALALSQADDFMKMQQIDRATSGETLGRIVPLDMRFPYPGGNSAYQELYTEMLRELRVLNRLRPKRKRDANLVRDAEAIAQVQWIARERRTSDERIVFVTGDALLALTYLKWHKNFILTQPGEPRVLRHIQQFAPILNLGDMDNRISDTKRFFEMLREGVETPLVAFNLSRDRKSQEGSKRSGAKADPLDFEVAQAGRSDLELRLLGVNESDAPIKIFFEQKLDRNWHVENQERFNTIGDAFREFERLAIGLSTFYVQRRAQAILDDIGSWDENVDLVQSAKNSIEGLFRSIAEKGTDTWFPAALSNLGRPKSQTSLVARTPLPLVLKVPTKAGQQLLVDMVDQWLAGKDIKESISEPLHSIRHLVFAIVSVAELRQGLWADANRYAKFAMSAAVSPLNTDSTGKTIDALQTEDYQELRYLRALCCRMQIGAAGPTDLVGDDVWASWLDEGVGQLDAYEAFYKEREQTKRQFHAVSERAALRGFYASWLPILTRRLEGKTPTSEDRGYSRGRAVEEFQLALQDLAAALDLIGQLNQSGNTPLDEHESIQAYANAAAAYALTKVCPDFSPAVFEEVLGRARIDEVARWWRSILNSGTGKPVIARLPPVVRKQLAVFLRDKDISPPFGEDVRQGRAPHLDLDHEMQWLLAELVRRQQAGAPSSTSSFADG